MATAINIIERIQSMILDESPETKLEIMRHLNAAYFEIAAEHCWHLLTKQVVQSTAVLPADLERIIYVEDDINYLYFKIGFPERYSNEKLFNYFDDMVYTTPLLTGSDGVVTANSKTFTSATGGFVSATHVGEFVSIGSNQGIYKIASVESTSSLTLVDAFRGDSATSQTFEIRPTGTRKLALCDERGDAITSTSLKLWYLQRPLPLYNDYDKIMLPSNCDALRIKVLRLMMESDKYDNDSLKQISNYDDALDKMKSLNPFPKRFIAPRNHFGERLAFGRQRVSRNVHPYRGS